MKVRVKEFFFFFIFDFETKFFYFLPLEPYLKIVVWVKKEVISQNMQSNSKVTKIVHCLRRRPAKNTSETKRFNFKSKKSDLK